MDQQKIYRYHAQRYHELVCAEDCEKNLQQTLSSLINPNGCRVVEVGAGTGRLTQIFVDAGADVVATDREEAMLQVARASVKLKKTTRIRFEQADASSLPVADGSCDFAVAGWVFGHFCKWMANNWQAEIAKALNEMRRSLREKGRLIVIETLGTAQTKPSAPNPGLATYYQWLEEEYGLQRKTIATDYFFPSVEDAVRVLAFFFGKDMGEKVRAAQWQRVPEWTGVWTSQPLEHTP